jgi:hypothetical protein
MVASMQALHDRHPVEVLNFVADMLELGDAIQREEAAEAASPVSRR